MPKVSTYTRTRIELLQKEGLHPAGIFKVLKREGLSVSFPSVARIVKKLKTTDTLANLLRSGRPSKLSTEAKAFIDQQMRKDDKMMSGQIQKKRDDLTRNKAGRYSGPHIVSSCETPTR